MKKIIGFVLVLICLGSCTSVKKYNEQITRLHAVKDLKTDVDKVYQQLQKNHPKLYQYTPKEVLDFKFDSLKTSINTPINSRDFYKKLAPVVAQVKQGHISVGSANILFTKKERKKLKKEKFEFYDLDFEYINNKLWVSNTRGEDSILIGSEVIKIEKEKTEDLLNVYRTQFSSDGYNKTLHKQYLGKRFSTLYYKNKGFKDSINVTFKLKDSLFSKTFKRIDKEKKKDSIATDSLKPTEIVKLSPLEKKEQRKAARYKRQFNRKHGLINKEEGYTRNFKFLESDSIVAYMNIKSFSNGNYKKFYKESFELLDSLKIEHLVLDLRDNGGGRIAEVDYLYAYLTNKPYVLLDPVEVNSRFPMLKFLLSNGNSTILKVFGVLALEPITLAYQYLKTNKVDDKIYFNLKYNKSRAPNNLNYKGQIYVITNGNSFSASSLLSTHLKANKRAVFVGEETGGAYNGCVAGFYKNYKMPKSKLKIRMGLMQLEAPYKQTPDGFGVKPDIEITPTLEDIIQHKDPELDWILNTIKTNEKLSK